jgi:hypothetical protein
MKPEDHTFLHDITIKLAKIDGFLGMLEMEFSGPNEKLQKMQKATTDAVELVQKYRAWLEKEEH